MRATLLLLAGLVGCNEYNIDGDGKVVDGVDDGTAPDIVVDPGSVDFGQIAVDATDNPIETVTVTNAGDAALQIRDLRLQDDNTPFSFTAIGVVLINPGESTTFTVSFDPSNSAPASTKVLIESNDPDTPTASVKLDGEGIAPKIDLSPDADDMGSPYIGCQLERPVTITNVGNSDLVVDQVEYVSSSETELDLDIDEATNGALPWTLTPGQAKVVTVLYGPLDVVEDDGYVTVHSNDPEQSEAKATQNGNGVVAGEKEDLYEQPVRSAVDLLWVVDNSGSMSEEQANLASNAEAFINTMVAADADYHIAVITTDSSEFRGEYITADMTDADAVSSFVEQAVPGIMGSGDEMGSEMAHQCFDGDDCSETDFLRDDARLQILYVTDETDSSKARSGWDWSQYVEYFQDLKDNPDDVTINAIAGDYPGGCATAYAGEGYYEQVLATDGLYLSICATDWADYLTTIGEEAAQQKNSFALTAEPVPATIVVTVDSITQYNGWTYDPVNNTVDFDDDHIPSGGATIVIDYALYGDCEE